MKLNKIYLAPDLQALYLKHRQEFLQIEREQFAPKFDRGTLEERFTDSRGRRYYGFPSTVELPLERYARLREFLSWLSSGVSGDELKRLLDAADSALAAGIKTGKNAARIGLVLSELRDRADLVLHHELLVHFLAVQLIREDERAEIFDGALHREKVEDLLKESREGNPFFFSLRWPELKKLRETFEWSPEEWSRYWTDSQTTLRRLDRVLKIASPPNESSSSAKTSTARS